MSARRRSLRSRTLLIFAVAAGVVAAELFLRLAVPWEIMFDTGFAPGIHVPDERFGYGFAPGYRGSMWQGTVRPSG